MAGKSTHSRVWSYGSSTVLSTLFFVGILTFLALIAERHPWRVDMTESGTFTLSEQTRNILNSLQQPIEIKAFYATAAPDETKAKDLLETYRYASNKVNFEFIDPDRQPDMARRFEVRSYGTLVLEGYGKKQSIQNADEESITNAILKLSSNEQKKKLDVILPEDVKAELLDLGKGVLCPCPVLSLKLRRFTVFEEKEAGEELLQGGLEE